MYVDLSLCPLDMFLYTLEVRFTQILESQLSLSQNLENGTFGEKIRTFLLRVAETSKLVYSLPIFPSKRTYISKGAWPTLPTLFPIAYSGQTLSRLAVPKIL